MRLDEWQSFIESQFLEDSLPPAPAPKVVEGPLVAPVEAPAEPLRTHEKRVAREIPVEAPAVAKRSVTPRAESGVVGILDTEIPEFSAYISRKAVETPKQLSVQNKREIVEPKVVEPKQRRQPVARARHARNVTPAAVEAGQSAADNWSQVPHHLQTLLALGREQDSEVAQSSYKRAFTETRQMLIARLIDPVLSLEETARLLNVCPTTVRRYTNRGILSHYRKEPDGGSQADGEKETRQRRFRLSDILAFLEAQNWAVDSERSRGRRRTVKEQSVSKHDSE